MPSSALVSILAVSVPSFSFNFSPVSILKGLQKSGSSDGTVQGPQFRSVVACCVKHESESRGHPVHFHCSGAGVRGGKKELQEPQSREDRHPRPVPPLSFFFMEAWPPSWTGLAENPEPC